MNINKSKNVKDNNKLVFVSVIVPMYNEELYINNCLLSLINQDYPKDYYEIIVIDGNSTDNSREIINSLIKKYHSIKIYDNLKRITPISFNIGIEKSRGEIIIFVGAHAICEKDYISQCVYLLNNSDASNVGGIQNAIGSNYTSNAVSYAMTSPFGVGNAYYHFSKKERYVDSVWGGAFKKETLEKLNGFNENYIKMQDYELNYRLRKMGGKILLSPKIRCNYFVRKSLNIFWKQYFIYGMWKVKGIVDHPDLLAFRHLIPPTFVIALLFSIILLFCKLKIGVIIPASYIIINLLFSAKISIKKGFKYFIILPVVFAIMNISWGVGFLFGLKKYGMPKINTKIIINSFNNIK